MSFSFSEKNINTEQQQLNNEFRSELTNILEWWRMHMVDEEHGGFYGRMDSYGQLYPRSDKGIILNSRLLWTYSASSLATGNIHYRELAERAYHFLCEYFWDNLYSGVFWSVDFLGNPKDTQKQIYAQAFTIYALSEYYLLTKDEGAIEKATELYWLTEKYSVDKQKAGYLNAFARDWGHMDDIRLSEKDANEAKIMNTHLHILEAYSNFFRVHPFTALSDSLRTIINLFVDHFYLPENGSLQIYFDEDWMPKGVDISFGHNIEASWLLWEAAELLNEESILERIRPIVIQMAETVFQSAVDKDGGIFYEANLEGLKDSDKHWWPQAEAVVGFWNAFQLTGDEKFSRGALNCWSFIKNYLLDKINGEWYWRTDRNGVPVLTENKAGPWKAPYHNTRMCLEMIKRFG